MQEEDEAEDAEAGSESGASGFVVPDDHLSGDEGVNNDQRDLDGLQAELHGALALPPSLFKGCLLSSRAWTVASATWTACRPACMVHGSCCVAVKASRVSDAF